VFVTVSQPVKKSRPRKRNNAAKPEANNKQPQNTNHQNHATNARPNSAPLTSTENNGASSGNNVAGTVSGTINSPGSNSLPSGNGARTMTSPIINPSPMLGMPGLDNGAGFFSQGYFPRLNPIVAPTSMSVGALGPPGILAGTEIVDPSISSDAVINSLGPLTLLRDGVDLRQFVNQLMTNSAFKEELIKQANKGNMHISLQNLANLIQSGTVNTGNPEQNKMIRDLLETTYKNILEETLENIKKTLMGSVERRLETRSMVSALHPQSAKHSHGHVHG